MNNGLTCGIRDVSPCLGCTEKFLACSDKCPKDARGEFGYNAWREKLRDVKEKRKQYYELRRRKW
jgi:Fe-S-cluster-containing dehydrogenase component